MMEVLKVFPRNQKLINLFMYTKRLEVFKKLANGDAIYAYEIYKISDMTYTFVDRFVTILKNEGLVVKNKIWGKRSIEISLTKKGLSIWYHLEGILRAIGEDV